MTAEFSPKTKRLIWDRATPDGYHVPMCEAVVTPACSSVATEIHHRKGRGKDPVLSTAANGAAVCRSCHQFIEDHAVYGTGLKIRKNGFELPHEVPVSYRGRASVYFRLDGTVEPIEGAA